MLMVPVPPYTNCSIEASYSEISATGVQLSQEFTAAYVPPAKSIGVSMSVLSGFFPTTFTSTPWLEEVALTLIAAPPFSEMLLKLYSAAGLLATRTRLTCDVNDTLGSERVDPPPSMMMSSPTTLH